MNLLTKLRRHRWVVTGRWKIKRQVRAAVKKGKLKLILGNSGTYYNGWIPTDLPHFDITNEHHWACLLGQYKADNLLAEHVLEHLTGKQVDKALGLAYQYLNSPGNFRIAVPDGFHPNPRYTAMVKPGYPEADSIGHVSYWTYSSLLALAQKHRFKIRLLEYYDESGVFHQAVYENEDGYVKRSKKNNLQHEEIPDYTSLIIDLYKE